MALPSVEKTWEVSLNNRMGGSGSADTDHRYALLNIYQTLLGFTNNPFTLVMSSDANTFGTPGPGWSVYTDLDWAQTGNRSWAVLQRPNTGGQILFHCYANNTSTYYYQVMEVTFSPSGGYTGGSLTAAPSATDERTMLSGNYLDPWYFGQGSATRRLSMHYRHSTDGKHTYCFFTSLGRCNQVLFMTTPEDAPASWTLPHLAAMVPDAGTDAENCDYGEFYSNQRFVGKDVAAGSNLSASMVIPSYDGVAFGAVLGDPSYFDSNNEFNMTSIQLGTTLGGAYGLLGRMPDIWAGPTTRGTGDTYPANGDRDFAQFGDFIVPWDGTVPVCW